ncbi:MAG: dicarboxylate/amino acid:cation symporter [Methylobacter sp.]|nr:dicarboxylate/amino acid:cation symporter [Methylobacter sp.]MDP2098521.1 dicarboxylate/amino acid:cation symporter [Methylobacter sp.]MDP2428248.1 dicarboxylate/amino acid:cation symporter [Methylobacter sp.]MDP3053761.1 dicarboxylate/amino acid:cation symporter [Methylobacter sp.]MDP3363982.1 dicarboxylate/amino acid:cation symporter [Methylobacter sp.]
MQTDYVAPKRHQLLYVQVLAAIITGIILGYYCPDIAVAMKPLGDGFIKLIKMIIAPIIFCTVVSGIAGMRELDKVGRVGIKALLYFEAVSTLALMIGLLVVHIVEPGVGMNVDASHLDTRAVSVYAAEAGNQSTVDFLLHIIPASAVDAFAKGDILQVLLVSLLFGFSLAAMKETGTEVVMLVNKISQVLFGIVETMMKLAPIGAFGAMAFTIGKYGIASLLPLASLMGSFYLTCLLFIFIVLGSIAKLAGFSIVKFIVYIKDELFIVLGTSSSESVLPRIMVKLENMGCSKSVVGLVIPTGYSFNLDGTSIYLAMAAIFVAQATNTPLTLTQELTLLGVLLLTSKGAAGVTGSGFITLAATLSVIPTIPIAGLALILGVDRFMSEARALTNLIGNGVATVVAAKWENELDMQQLNAAFDTYDALKHT